MYIGAINGEVTFTEQRALNGDVTFDRQIAVVIKNAKRIGHGIRTKRNGLKVI